MADPPPDDLITQIDYFISMVPSGDTFYRAEARRFIVRASAALKVRDEEIARLKDRLKYRAVVMPMWQARAEAAEAKAARLQSLICGVNLIADEAPELNMSNYDEADVVALNDAMINVWQTTADELREVTLWKPKPEPLHDQ